MSPAKLIGGAVAVLTGLLVLCMGALASCGGAMTATSLGCADPDGCPPADLLPAWDDEQLANAAVIVTVGQTMTVPAWGQVVAVAAAIQESSLRNLPHQGESNDHDSVGLFQQRPSQGWGTEQQLLDPGYAAQAFYTALLRVDGWEQVPLAEAAQAVQNSAHPDAYTQWTAHAVAMVAVLGGPGAEGEGVWTQPVHAELTSGFRTPGRPDHQGVDLAAARDTVIVTASAGVVQTVACNAHHVNGSEWGCDRDGDPQLTVGCGWYVDITHPGPVTTRYCHMETEPWVRVGDPVLAGQPIGLVGSTGHSSGPHLHFEVHAPHPVDPASWMADQGVPLS